MEVKINNNGEMLDATIEMVDGVMVVSPKEEKVDITKFKDGDVVYVKTNHENIIIYKEQSNKLGRYVNYMDEQYLSIDKCDFFGSIYDIIEIRPATEEEKKKLFDKLKEEGLEWKADTKELVELRWKPKSDGIYYYPSMKPQKGRVISIPKKERNTELPFDKEIIDAGWVFKTEEECQEFCNRLNDAIISVKL